MDTNKAGEQPTITLLPCPFCDRPATWRPIEDGVFNIPFGVIVGHTDDCWLHFEYTGRVDFDTLPERWNTRTTSLAAQLDALKQTRDALRKLQPSLNVMAREIIDDIITDKIEKALS